MKAAIWTNYGPPEVIIIDDIDTPHPKNNEVLIKIHAATVTLGDCELRGSYLPLWIRYMIRLYVGFWRPKRVKILGQECAGEIVEVGSEVTDFKIGDKVVAGPGLSMGCHAQYLAMSVQSSMGFIVKMNPGITYMEASTLPVGAMNAHYFLNLANLKEGDTILINGAGGTIGTYAITLAKLKGAIITAVDRSEKFEMMTRLGAEICLDYRETNFTKMNTTYDVIFDIVGKASLLGCRKRLNPGGTYLSANPRPATMIGSALLSLLTDKSFKATAMSPSKTDLHYLMQLIADGMIEPEIDREYTLDQTVEAHRYIETGLKQGHVILTLNSNNEQI